MDTAGSDEFSRFAESLPGAALRVAAPADGPPTCRLLNAGARALYGLEPSADPCGPAQLWAMVHPDDLDVLTAAVADSKRTFEPWERRFRILDAQGERKTLIGRGLPTRLAGGGAEWLILLFDITVQATAEHRFETASAQLRLISEAIPDGFALFDRAERLVICNQRFLETYELEDAPGLIEMSYADILRHAAKQRIFPASDGREEAWIADRLADFRAADRTPEERHGAARWFRILDRPTEEGGRVALRIETTRTRNREADLRRDALTDSLTGLWNRRGLSEHFKDVSAKLAPGEVVALIHLDLDKFKAINDMAGHEAGDAVLLEVARRLSRLAGSRAAIARLGGDEFVVAWPTSLAQPQIARAVEALRLALVEPFRFRGRAFQAGASFGVALWTPGGPATPERCMLDADTALMHGKMLGRNRTVFFSEDMRGDAERAARMAADIKQGLACGEFLPYFQPQMDLARNVVTGVEMLARWRGPDGRLIPAHDFVQIARETGLAGEIDEGILPAGLTLLRDLVGAGWREARIALNLSSGRLRDPGVVGSLLDEVFAAGVSPSQVAIEILESTLLDDRCDMAASNVHSLAQAGFRIELDNFGAGHAALSSLRRFPVHRIKIDRSLVHDIDRDAALRATVEGIALLAERMGVDVIAEGVETDAERLALRSIGIHDVQGYGIAEPMDAEDLRRWLALRRWSGADPLQPRPELTRLPMQT